jgi:hypothetical protein
MVTQNELAQLAEQEARDLAGDMARTLAEAVERIDDLLGRTPAGKDWRQLARQLRTLRGPLHGALLQLQDLEPYAVLKTLAEWESPLLCVCPAGGA